MVVAAGWLVACDSSGGSSKAATSSTSTPHAAPHHDIDVCHRVQHDEHGTTDHRADRPVESARVGPRTSDERDLWSQAAAITAAVHGGDLGPVPVADYATADCRIAPANPIWAAVDLTPKPGKSVIPLIVALERARIDLDGARLRDRITSPATRRRRSRPSSGSAAEPSGRHAFAGRATQA